jgi:hypothetical protein
MLAKLIKKSLFNRFDDYVDTQVYNTWLSRYDIIRKSGKQPFMPEMPEKYFSQNDEDGYSLKIMERFGGALKSFVEIGIGNGLENNTLILRANGLKGLWIDTKMLTREIRLNPRSNDFRFVNEFVTKNNINGILQRQLGELNFDQFDILSIDIDSNDLEVLSSIISVFRPKVIIAEVNSKLGPYARWNFSSESKSTPAGDNFGVSYLTLKETLSDKQYRYLAMNAATGLNAFFIDDNYNELFPELKSKIDFVPPFYRWPKKMFGFSSYALVNSILNG